MDIFAPSYYKKFKCIADKCHHNCCIGWEIDIDDEALGTIDLEILRDATGIHIKVS